MKKFDSDKLIRTIIYVLTIFLIVLILYNCILLLNIHFHNKTSYKNSLRVDKKIVNDIYDVFNINSSYKVNFKENDMNKLPSIQNSKITILTYDALTHKKNYSAIFFDNSFIKDSSVESFSNINKNAFSKINFLDYENLKKEFNDSIDTVSIVNSDYSYLTILYYKNGYHYFDNANQNINTYVNNPIIYKNIVIDISAQKQNTLYVYSSGLFKEVKKDSDLNLTKGATFWLNLNSDSKIYYTFSDIENKIINN